MAVRTVVLDANVYVSALAFGGKPTRSARFQPSEAMAGAREAMGLITEAAGRLALSGPCLDLAYKNLYHRRHVNDAGQAARLARQRSA